MNFIKKTCQVQYLLFIIKLKKRIFAKYLVNTMGLKKENMHEILFILMMLLILTYGLQKKKIVDIINVGTGTSTSFQFIANIIIKKLQKGKIEYIKFPNKFKGKYQSLTKANISKLRKLGYKKKITNIDKGISLYLNKLNNE